MAVFVTQSVTNLELLYPVNSPRQISFSVISNIRFSDALYTDITRFLSRPLAFLYFAGQHVWRRYENGIPVTLSGIVPYVTMIVNFFLARVLHLVKLILGCNYSAVRTLELCENRGLPS